MKDNQRNVLTYEDLLNGLKSMTRTRYYTTSVAEVFAFKGCGYMAEALVKEAIAKGAKR